jgi:hypothetical protein
MKYIKTYESFGWFKKKPDHKNYESKKSLGEKINIFLQDFVENALLIVPKENEFSRFSIMIEGKVLVYIENADEIDVELPEGIKVTLSYLDEFLIDYLFDKLGKTSTYSGTIGINISKAKALRYLDKNRKAIKAEIYLNYEDVSKIEFNKDDFELFKVSKQYNL